MVDDVLAYVDSIGEPTRLVGWSLGADLALAAARAQPDTMDAVAPVEPVMPRLLNEQEQAALGGAVARTGELAADGRLTDAMRTFAGFPFNDEDIAAAEDTGYKPYALRAARRVVDHVPHARIREIPGAGHAAPLTHPETLAEALTEFFAPAQQPA